MAETVNQESVSDFFVLIDETADFDALPAWTGEAGNVSGQAPARAVLRPQRASPAQAFGSPCSAAASPFLALSPASVERPRLSARHSSALAHVAHRRQQKPGLGQTGRPLVGRGGSASWNR